MRTQYFLKLHKKSLDVLEMLEKARARRSDAIKYINKGKTQQTAWHYLTLPKYEKQFTSMSAIIERLILRYAELVKQIAQPVIENPNCNLELTECKPGNKSNAVMLGDIKVNVNGYATSY